MFVYTLTGAKLKSDSQIWIWANGDALSWITIMTSECTNGRKVPLNKKLLLRDPKRHTVRGIATIPCSSLGAGGGGGQDKEVPPLRRLDLDMGYPFPYPTALLQCIMARVPPVNRHPWKHYLPASFEIRAEIQNNLIPRLARSETWCP